VISELLPARGGEYRYANSDPVTGQAAWYDLRVRIEKADAQEIALSEPRFASLPTPAGLPPRPSILRYGGALPRQAGVGAMTSLPPPPAKRLGLVIDLDICVGCHACAVNCKEWNTGGEMAPLTDRNPYGADMTGVWFNRIHSFEVGDDRAAGRTVHFPRSCLHCAEPACVTVCPTGASLQA